VAHDGAIPRLDAAQLSNARFNREYYSAAQPLLVCGALAGWAALGKWSPQHFKAHLGHKIVTLKSNRQGVFNRNHGADTGAVTLSSIALSQAVDLILSPGETRHYLQQLDIGQQFPELLSDLAPPYLLDESKQILTANLWFGGAGCKSPLHFDSADNFLAQVFGTKLVTLFAPEHGACLYPALGDTNPHTSRVNVFAPDLSKFPLYAAALPYRLQGRIAPGDMLFIPQGWWHAVESLDVCASVNIWWGRAGAVSVDPLTERPA
jgi:hypothetical protein